MSDSQYLSVEIQDRSEKELCTLWRQGDTVAATELYRRYVDRLIRVLRRGLATRYLRRIDPESVMISAFASLLRRTREDRFEFADDEDVWKTLVTIGLNKLRNRVRQASTQKANLDREVQLVGDYQSGLANMLSLAPGEDSAIVFADLLEQLMNRLSVSDQEILRLRLEGNSTSEISDLLTVRITSRSVSRRLNGPIASVARSLMSEKRNLSGSPDPASRTDGES